MLFMLLAYYFHISNVHFSMTILDQTVFSLPFLACWHSWKFSGMITEELPLCRVSRNCLFLKVLCSAMTDVTQGLRAYRMEQTSYTNNQSPYIKHLQPRYLHSRYLQFTVIAVKIIH